MRRLAALSLCSVAVVAAGCGSSDSNDSSGTKGKANATTNDSSTAGGGVEVSMKDIQFSPKATDVKVGQKVTWTNDDSVDHNVVADSGASFKSADFGNGGKYAFMPKKAGAVKYECTIHPGMTGTLRITQ